MPENLSYLSGIGQIVPPSGYNTQPLNFFNPFRIAFGYTDGSLFKDRARYMTMHGAYFGLLPVTFLETMRLHLTDSPNFTFLNKGRFLTSSAFYGVMGAASFFSYIAGVKLVDDLRGNPDDELNHFFGGFFLTLPSAIYRRSPTVFLQYGFQLGILAGIFKHLYKHNYRIWNVDNDPTKVTYCRYPELYAWTVGVPLTKQEEIKKAKAYQQKDL